MVAHAGGYYVAYFKGFWGVTQEYPMPSTILNVVVDVVVHHWILLVSGDAGGHDRWGREVLHQAPILYADYRLVASTDPVWLQGAFDTLIRLFDRVGLWKNVGKTVGVICRPCYALGTQREADYKLKMNGEGLTYRSRQRLRVKCSDCGADLVTGLLVLH